MGLLRRPTLQLEQSNGPGEGASSCDLYRDAPVVQPINSSSCLIAAVRAGYSTGSLFVRSGFRTRGGDATARMPQLFTCNRRRCDVPSAGSPSVRVLLVYARSCLVCLRGSRPVVDAGGGRGKGCLRRGLSICLCWSPRICPAPGPRRTSPCSTSTPTGGLGLDSPTTATS